MAKNEKQKESAKTKKFDIDQLGRAVQLISYGIVRIITTSLVGAILTFLGWITNNRQITLFFTIGVLVYIFGFISGTIMIFKGNSIVSDEEE
jgi:sulfite exporter TauE/SafE